MTLKQIHNEIRQIVGLEPISNPSYFSLRDFEKVMDAIGYSSSSLPKWWINTKAGKLHPGLENHRKILDCLASRARRRGVSIKSSRRKAKPYFSNPMLEMDYEEIDDLPVLANPRRNGMRRRKNMSRENSPRRALMAKYRKKHGPNWASDIDVYVEYFIERKRNSGSDRSDEELEAAARENFRKR